VIRSCSVAPKFLSAAGCFLAPQGKKALLCLQHDIRLAEAEANAAKRGVTAFEKLLPRRRDVLALAGPAPRQLPSGLAQIEPTKESRA
jgi:hypothetical protein